jgi:hypothetical protein
MSENIIIDQKGNWRTESCNNLLGKIWKNCMMRQLNNGVELSQKRLANSRVLRPAWIRIGAVRKKCFVDIHTMKAYKADGDKATYIEIKKFISEGWADC